MNTVILSLLWIVAFIFIVRRSWSTAAPSVGLTLGYVFNLSMYHWFGAFIYWFPSYQTFAQEKGASGVLGREPFHFTHEGFELAFWALLAFTVGAVILAPMILRNKKIARTVNAKYAVKRNIIVVYFLTGFIVMMFIQPILSNVPSVGTLLSGGQILLASSLCLMSWLALQKSKKAGVIKPILLGVFLFPCYGLVVEGFLGYGIATLSGLIFFIFCYYKPRWQIVLAFIVAVYLGLSVFVNYLAERGEIRSAVWGGRDVISRIDTSANIFRNFEFFDITNINHLMAIDYRLNQNYIVGRAIDHMNSGLSDYKYGSTILGALYGFIPRIVWPTKPIIAGSEDLVSNHTGIKFAEGTSVGIGNILESYINFGKIGVVILFLIFGAFVSFVDTMAASRLFESNWKGFILWFIPGFSMIQPLGSFSDITMTVAGAFIFCFVINYILFQNVQKRIA